MKRARKGRLTGRSIAILALACAGAAAPAPLAAAEADVALEAHAGLGPDSVVPGALLHLQGRPVWEAEGLPIAFLTADASASEESFEGVATVEFVGFAPAVEAPFEIPWGEASAIVVRPVPESDFAYDTVPTPTEARFEVRDPSGAPLAVAYRQVTVLPATYWTWTIDGRDLTKFLPALVTPRAKAVHDLLLEAVALHGGPLPGDADEDALRATTRAIYEVLSRSGASFTEDAPAQRGSATPFRVRSPGETAEIRRGTSLEGSLLLAAAFERAGLHPALVVGPDHAFAGALTRWGSTAGLLPVDPAAIGRVGFDRMVEATNVRIFPGDVFDEESYVVLNVTGLRRVGVSPTPYIPDLGRFASLPRVTIGAPTPGATLVGKVLADGTAHAPGAPLLRVEWRVDDGEWRNAEGMGRWRAALDASIVGTGAHLFEVRATDAAGRTNSRAVPFHLAAGDPAASFTLGDADLERGEAVTADATASASPNGPVVTYQWEWGDGARGEGAIATHAYAEAGTYTVRLTIFDLFGRTATGAASVIVREELGAPGGAAAISGAEPPLLKLVPAGGLLAAAGLACAAFALSRRR